MGHLQIRDLVRFFGCVFWLGITHSLLFTLDSHDVTQFMVIAAAYTLLCAFREGRPNA